MEEAEEDEEFNIGVENLRRTNILEILLDHLIAMAEKSRDFRTFSLGRIYLTQAKRLCQLYIQYGCDMGATEYISSIEYIESQLLILNQSEAKTSLPELPISADVVNSPSKIKNKTKKLDKGVEQKVINENIYVRHIPASPKNQFEPRRSIKFRDEVTEHVSDVSDTMKTDAEVHKYTANSILKKGPQRRESLSSEASQSEPEPTLQIDKTYKVGQTGSRTLEEKRAIIREMLKDKSISEC